jgi:hypothetical protein
MNAQLLPGHARSELIFQRAEFCEAACLPNCTTKLAYCPLVGIELPISRHSLEILPMLCEETTQVADLVFGRESRHGPE